MCDQVLLSEIYTDPGGARVVVKELKANASAKEQNDFLQQGDPYRWTPTPEPLWQKFIQKYLYDISVMLAAPSTFPLTPLKSFLQS